MQDYNLQSISPAPNFDSQLDEATSQICAYLKSLGVDARPAPYLKDRYGRKLHEVKLSELAEFEAAKGGNLRYVELKNSSIDAIKLFIEVGGEWSARGRLAYIVDAHAIGVRYPQKKRGKGKWVGRVAKFLSMCIGGLFLLVSIIFLTTVVPGRNAPPQSVSIAMLTAGIILIGWPICSFLLEWYRERDWRLPTKHLDVKTKKVERGVFPEREGFRWVGGPLANALNQDMSLTERLYHEEGKYGNVRIDLSGPSININSPPSPWVNIHVPLTSVFRPPSMEALRLYDRIARHIRDYAEAIQWNFPARQNLPRS